MTNLNKISLRGIKTLLGVTLFCVALTGCGRKLGCNVGPDDECMDHQPRTGIAHCIGECNTVVHFDFDKSNIRKVDHEKLNMQANYMKDHPNARFLVEGYCDERGTQEYNLALGDRRANAVRNYLLKQCSVNNEICTTSYGKERPVDLGHNEDAWAKNRRAVTIEQ